MKNWRSLPKIRYHLRPQRSGTDPGLEFTVPAGPIVSKALLEEKLVLISAGSHIIRFVPPLIIQKSDVDEMAARLERVLKNL